jgi:demethylmenaquinone methyltransferase/2-methoxy-6-polyprenyl-1,4-benzoquinol methylase
MTDTRGKIDFGYREVDWNEKQKLVGRVFTSVADKYDLMNDLMSFGIHRLWKRHFVATSGVRRGARVLDLAGGTGDIAALLAERVGAEGEIVLGDINAEMLGVGRDRMTDRGLVGNLRYVRLNAEALPFPDGHFDAGHHCLRPAQRHRQTAALREMCRVLKRRRQGHGARVFRGQPTRCYVRCTTCTAFEVLPRLGQADRQRCRQLPIPRRVDPQAPEPGHPQADDARGRLRPHRLPQPQRRHRRDS